MADLHTHTSDDPWDNVPYSAEELIDAAAARGVQVLAITCHGVVAHTPYFSEYAHRRGMLLIPGIELFVEGRHVLVLNPDSEQACATTFAELRRLGPREAAIIAPHPYFPVGMSLMGKLEEHIDLFHAVEYHSFYTRMVNFNRKAVRAAKQFGLPLVGTTDNHTFPYVPSTYTWIDAEPTITAVIDAVRGGAVTVASKPRPVGLIVQTLAFTVRQTAINIRERKQVPGAVAV
ncbi:MAG: PHP domain-containing protein [Candidatus Hydrogenedentales bacterium]